MSPIIVDETFDNRSTISRDIPLSSISESQIITNLISKKTFCKLLNFLKDQSIRYDELNEKMSALCPGFHVNFYPQCEAETLIINFLDEQFNFTSSEDSMIDYFVYELKYGTDKDLLSSLSLGGEHIDLSTPEALYDFLLQDLLRHPSEATISSTHQDDPHSLSRSQEAVYDKINSSSEK